MKGIGVVVFGVVVCVCVGLLLNSIANAPSSDQKAARAVGEATRLAIENERAQVEVYVARGAADARIAAAQARYVGLSLVLLIFALLLALVLPFWMYNRATMAYARRGLYPVVVQRGLSGTTVVDPNRLLGANPMITSQAQAIQLAAALSEGDGMTPTERRTAMQEIGRTFQPARSPALLDPPIVQSTLTAAHVERLLLESGVRDDDDA